MANNGSRTAEQTIINQLTKAGWAVMPPPPNTNGYNFEAVKGKEVIAVQVKTHKFPVKVPHVERFLNFFDLPAARRFTRGLLVSSNGFTPNALTYFSNVNSQKVKLAVIKEDVVHWIRFADRPQDRLPQKLVYVGVFTCKGGVGKTTISAHLAGAIALSGYNVAIIDLDPQKNLTTLLDQGVILPGVGDEPAHTVKVFSLDEWDTSNPPADIRMAVCDCSPVFEENPVELLAKLSYCLIPTTLNPLGLNKNGYVIKNTLKAIRSVNKDAYVFVLINNYFKDEAHKARVLKEQYKKYFARLSELDDRFHFIDPDEVSIRNSKQLFYWGYHIYSGEPAELAFTPIGGKCAPKADFLNLLDYLEAHSDIGQFKNPDPASLTNLLLQDPLLPCSTN
ncbi:nucleotide-binding protein [Leptodesmis sichuanensis]|uniref:nucleotide-binding protein n=1 Tax=Leptodesmis sichuanensis TaxID=2906798 RepID=UPI001F234FC5|nr:AAA family ATPase [Leptodesmis sichuanensis]UIE38987.1 AAA family ATPase [Leptodesmis sichuanensis A121]